MPAADGVRFRVRVPVRFRDMDAMGHVHHTVPLLYLEEARAAYWRDVAGRSMVEDIDYVMGEVTVRYERSIHYPGVVEVGVQVTEMGRSSFRMAFEIRDETGQLLVTGTTTQVLFDYHTQRSKPIPEELRARIEAYERHAGEPILD